MKRIVFLLAAGFVFQLCFSAFQENVSVISGRITDHEGNPLPGAGVTVEGTSKGVLTDQGGFYMLSGLKDGTYVISISFLGYENIRRELNLKGRAVLDISLVPALFTPGNVMVDAVRAGAKTPLAYTTIGEEAIRKMNTGMDLPYLLNLTPSLVETSEAGNGVGYTNMRIRGTDASRINVTIDGIPLNDPESQQVFWVDLPDLASSVDNIQIQRGAGTSTNGAGAFGATVSIQTKNPDNEPFAQIMSSAGSFNTFKNTVTAGTGLLGGRFALQMRMSQLRSDGYIDRTGSDHRSAYVSGVLAAGRSRIKANILLGEEHTGIGWWGVPMEMLETNRRYNPAGEYTDENGVVQYYDNESDNYRQDHYQLIYGLKASYNLSFSTALHYTRGKGYYEEYKDDREISDYFPVPGLKIGDTVITYSDLITRKWLINDFYGIVSSLRYRDSRTEASFGLGANYYSGDHFGKIIWMQYLPPEKDYEWYNNNGKKGEISLFTKVTYSLTDDLSVYGDLQYRFVNYRMKGRDDDQKDLGQEHDFGFFNPKAGLFWSITPAQDAYLSFSVAGREPTRADFKEAAGDPESTPRKETLYDTELGYRVKGPGYSVGINGYFMYYHDQLVPTGELSSTGYSIMTNVNKSSRAGIELSTGIQPAAFLRWNINLTLSRNKINNFTAYYIDYDTTTFKGVYKSKNLGSVDIAYSPSVTGTSDLNFMVHKNLEIHLISKYVGKQYFDNTMSSERTIDHYFVNNMLVSYEPSLRKIKNLEFQLMVNNIFNSMYESNAYGGSWYEAGREKTWAYFFPQAGTNFMVKVMIRF